MVVRERSRECGRVSPFVEVADVYVTLECDKRADLCLRLPPLIFLVGGPNPVSGFFLV